MKELLLEIINKDNSYNKSATRYLYKTDPNLWKKIVEATAFLPDSAMPKQRIWHIINDIYEIPVCPITGQKVKWVENRYLKTLNRAAKRKLQHQRGDLKNCYTPEINEKRRQGNLLAVANGRKYRSNVVSAEEKEKRKQTFIEKYGVDNPSKHLDVRKKISEASIKAGATPIHLRSLRKIYYDRVKYFTEQSWTHYFNKINPTRLNRSEVDVDHIYSIQQGFRNNIPPYIIGHWTNLRMLDKAQNYSKGMRCDKTKEELFEDFFSSIDE